MKKFSIETIVGAVVFLYSFILYTFTVSPTASFWDCGEFIAIANRLQVSHPPGAPFYMILGRFVSMFAPTPYISLAVNMLSVLGSALTVLFAHLSIVYLIKEWKGNSDAWSKADMVEALAGGVIGSLTFAVTDSFWFNAVEAEVYSLSMFFTAVVVWLIMKWTVEIKKERVSLSGASGFNPITTRYLVIIAYIFGLAIGIHLLNLLAIFFVALIVFFERFDQPEWSSGKRFSKILIAGLIASVAFFSIYPGIILWLPELANKLDSLVISLGGVALLTVGAVYYTQKNRKPVANMMAVSFLVVLIGYSTYALIFIRSAANPPIDENDPENVEAIVSYLKRDQYGSTPLMSGLSYDNRTRNIDKEKAFPRRYSPMPAHVNFYSRYKSDGQYFMDYQIRHMYVRYFMWNFSGKESDVQDAAWLTGFEAKPQFVRPQTPSESKSRNVYFMLPFLLGLFGMVYHIKRDWRRAFSVGMLFFVTGIGIIIYLNQTPMQPRERDYSYVASFFAFSLWIGIGATAAIEWLRSLTSKTVDPSQSLTGPIALAAILFLMIPGWMAYQNYDDHDRSGRYVATDYAYNLLNSLEENAILFTNGDNDTFPLWYLQEVEGVRQDVRVVCLSLLNTPWYIKQMKNQFSRDSAPLPVSFTDGEIDKLEIQGWQPRQISIPVDTAAIFQRDELLPVSRNERGKLESPMQWTLQGRRYSDEFNLLQVVDMASLDIITSNAREGWKRPVYFANTTSTEGQLNLQDYFQSEGLAYRIVPIKNDGGLGGSIVPEIALDRFRKFKFTNLNDEGVYFDENIRRMMDNYRITYTIAAQDLIDKGRMDEAKEILSTLREKIPYETIPSGTYSALLMTQAMNALGDSEMAVEMAKTAGPYALGALENAQSEQDISMVQQFISLIQYTFIEFDDLQGALDFSNQLADATGDESHRESMESLERFRSQLKESQSRAAAPSEDGGQ